MSVVEQEAQAQRAGGCSPLRGQAREQAILHATMDLVAEIGYDRVTVDAIAARAKASKATMYRRWPGKVELVAAALLCHAEESKPPLADTGSLRTDLLAAMSGMSCSFAGEDGPSLVTLVTALRSDAALRSLMSEQIDHKCHEVGELLTGRAVARGETVVTANAASVMALAFARLFTETLLTGGAPSLDAQRQLVDEVLLPLLGATTPVMAPVG